MKSPLDTKLKNNFSEFFSGDFNFFIKEKTVRTGNFHWHDYFELEIVLDGNGKHHFKGKTGKIKRGSIYLVTPLDFHYIECEDNSPLLLVNMKFDQTVLSREVYRTVAALGGFSSELGEDELKDAENIIEKITKEFEEKQPDGDIMIRALFESLLIPFLRRKPDTLQNDKEDIQNSYIKSAITYINYHFRENITASDVANEVNLSGNYFGEIFKEKVGMGFSEYLKKCRLKYAEKLLCENDMSVSVVAEESGFSNTSYFIENFKKEYGMTPYKYLHSKK